MNHLPFAINKQKRSDAIQKDEINELGKRSLDEELPTSRASDIGPVSPLNGTQHDSWWHWIANELNVLGTKFKYFDGGGSDCVVRKISNACSYICFALGTMGVALGFSLPLERQLMDDLEWLRITF